MQTRLQKRKSTSRSLQMAEEAPRTRLKRNHHLEEQEEEQEQEQEQNASPRVHGSSTQFSRMLTTLNGSSIHEKLATLAELSEFLSIATGT